LRRSPTRSALGASRAAPFAPAPDSGSRSRRLRRTATLRVPNFNARPARLVSWSGTVTLPPRAFGGPVTLPSILTVRACADAGMAASRSSASKVAPRRGAIDCRHSAVV
jgi:hypothetical protein